MAFFCYCTPCTLSLLETFKRALICRGVGSLFPPHTIKCNGQRAVCESKFVSYKFYQHFFCLSNGAGKISNFGWRATLCHVVDYIDQIYLLCAILKESEQLASGKGREKQPIQRQYMHIFTFVFFARGVRSAKMWSSML